METTIPIYNLYYLLCYAWDRLEERDLIDVGSTRPPRDTLNLLGQVLSNGVRTLIRRGFERGYSERREELAGVRGRPVLESTLRRQLPMYGRAECVFDELEHDTPANRVIVATLTVLTRSALVEQELRHELAGLRRHFRDVRLVRAKASDCRRVVIHRNNRHYGFVVEVCSLILDLILPDEAASETRFRDFSRDHKSMARLFEDFVRNFYRKHANECGITQVTSQKIKWAGEPADESSALVWPTMQSDISLIREGPPLVIDCKFYSDVVTEGQHGGERLHSKHLYQIFTYTQNLATVPGWEQVEGLLLYAESGIEVEVSHAACGRRLRAATVNLNEDWPRIHDRLISLVQAKRSAQTM